MLIIYLFLHNCDTDTQMVLEQEVAYYMHNWTYNNINALSYYDANGVADAGVVLSCLNSLVVLLNECF